ncbi:MAG: PEP-CTERM sorting domain-containing protein [Phycisphaerales bacterium]
MSLQLSITYDANAGYYAFAHSDVIANASDSNLIGAFAGYGSNLISHFAFEQLDPNSVLYHCSQPHAAGAPASTENPAWVAEFVWWTTDFTPRTVEISTSTVDFAMYLHQNLPGSQSIPLSSIQDVTITLQVIPAPSSALALFAGAGLLGARRRRRQ